MSVLDCLQKIAVAPLAGYAHIQLTGADALSFLHRLSTQNCRGLQPGHGCLNAVLTPKGRFVGVLHQAVLPDNSVLLVGGCNQQQHIQQWLEDHLFTEEVQLHDVSNQYTLWWVMGQQATNRFQQLLNHPPPLAPWQCLLHNGDVIMRTFACIDAYEKQVPAWLVCARHTPTNSLMNALQSHDNSHTLHPDEIETVRIASGIPSYDNEINNHTNPLQLGLHAAIDTDKGCYVGQEVISRLITYNKVKGQLVKITCNEQAHQQLHIGQRVLVGQQQQIDIGHVTSVSPLYTPQAAIALALVQPPTGTTLPTNGWIQHNKTSNSRISLISRYNNDPIS